MKFWNRNRLAFYLLKRETSFSFNDPLAKTNHYGKSRLLFQAFYFVAQHLRETAVSYKESEECRYFICKFIELTSKANSFQSNPDFGIHLNPYCQPKYLHIKLT